MWGATVSTQDDRQQCGGHCIDTTRPSTLWGPLYRHKTAINSVRATFLTQNGRQQCGGPCIGTRRPSTVWGPLYRHKTTGNSVMTTISTQDGHQQCEGHCIDTRWPSTPCCPFVEPLGNKQFLRWRETHNAMLCPTKVIDTTGFSATAIMSEGNGTNDFLSTMG